MIEIGYHVRPTAADVPPGTYRIVGVSDGVTLLSVADADGRRVHSGAVRTFPADRVEAGFEPAPNPDAGFTPLRTAKNAVQGLYWQFRKFL